MSEVQDKVAEQDHAAYDYESDETDEDDEDERKETQSHPASTSETSESNDVAKGDHVSRKKPPRFRQRELTYLSYSFWGCTPVTSKGRPDTVLAANAGGEWNDFDEDSEKKSGDWKEIEPQLLPAADEHPGLRIFFLSELVQRKELVQKLFPDPFRWRGKLRIISATNLAKADPLFWKSDPFCKVYWDVMDPDWYPTTKESDEHCRCCRGRSWTAAKERGAETQTDFRCQQKEKSKYVLQTNAKKNTLHPRWDERKDHCVVHGLRWPQPEPAGDDALPRIWEDPYTKTYGRTASAAKHSDQRLLLRIELWDQDQIGSNDFLGAVHLTEKEVLDALLVSAPVQCNVERLSGPRYGGEKAQEKFVDKRAKLTFAISHESEYIIKEENLVQAGQGYSGAELSTTQKRDLRTQFRKWKHDEPAAQKSFKSEYLKDGSGNYYPEIMQVEDLEAAIKDMQRLRCPYEAIIDERYKGDSHEFLVRKRIVDAGDMKQLRKERDSDNEKSQSWQWVSRPQTRDTDEVRISVTCFEAKRLAKADTVGKSDPYCVIRWDDEVVHRTKVVKNTLDPVWTEKHDRTKPGLQLPKHEEQERLQERENLLTIEVWDWDNKRYGQHQWGDNGNDDFLGEVSLSYRDLADIIANNEPVSRKLFSNTGKYSDKYSKESQRKGAMLKFQVSDLTRAPTEQQDLVVCSVQDYRNEFELSEQSRPAFMDSQAKTKDEDEREQIYHNFRAHQDRVEVLRRFKPCIDKTKDVPRGTQNKYNAQWVKFYEEHEMDKIVKKSTARYVLMLTQQQAVDFRDMNKIAPGDFFGGGNTECLMWSPPRDVLENQQRTHRKWQRLLGWGRTAADTCLIPGGFTSPRVLLVGLGEAEDVTEKSVREATRRALIECSVNSNTEALTFGLMGRRKNARHQPQLMTKYGKGPEEKDKMGAVEVYSAVAEELIERHADIPGITVDKKQPFGAEKPSHLREVLFDNLFLFAINDRFVEIKVFAGMKKSDGETGPWQGETNPECAGNGRVSFLSVKEKLAKAISPALVDFQSKIKNLNSEGRLDGEQDVALDKRVEIKIPLTTGYQVEQAKDRKPHALIDAQFVQKLRVDILRCKDLKNVDAVGASDPYVQVSFNRRQQLEHGELLRWSRHGREDQFKPYTQQYDNNLNPTFSDGQHYAWEKEITRDYFIPPQVTQTQDKKDDSKSIHLQQQNMGHYEVTFTVWDGETMRSNRPIAKRRIPASELLAMALKSGTKSPGVRVDNMPGGAYIMITLGDLTGFHPPDKHHGEIHVFAQIVSRVRLSNVRVIDLWDETQKEQSDFQYCKLLWDSDPLPFWAWTAHTVKNNGQVMTKKKKKKGGTIDGKGDEIIPWRKAPCHAISKQLFGTEHDQDRHVVENDKVGRDIRFPERHPGPHCLVPQAVMKDDMCHVCGKDDISSSQHVWKCRGDSANSRCDFVICISCFHTEMEEIGKEKNKYAEMYTNRDTQGKKKKNKTYIKHDEPPEDCMWPSVPCILRRAKAPHQWGNNFYEFQSKHPAHKEWKQRDLKAESDGSEPPPCVQTFDSETKEGGLTEKTFELLDAARRPSSWQSGQALTEEVKWNPDDYGVPGMHRMHYPPLSHQHSFEVPSHWDDVDHIPVPRDDVVETAELEDGDANIDDLNADECTKENIQLCAKVRIAASISASVLFARALGNMRTITYFDRAFPNKADMYNHTPRPDHTAIALMERACHDIKRNHDAWACNGRSSSAPEPRLSESAGGMHAPYKGKTPTGTSMTFVLLDVNKRDGGRVELRCPLGHRMQCRQKANTRASKHIDSYERDKGRKSGMLMLRVRDGKAAQTEPLYLCQAKTQFCAKVTKDTIAYMCKRPNRKRKNRTQKEHKEEGPWKVCQECYRALVTDFAQSAQDSVSESENKGKQWSNLLGLRMLSQLSQSVDEDVHDEYRSNVRLLQLDYSGKSEVDGPEIVLVGHNITFDDVYETLGFTRGQHLDRAYMHKLSATTVLGIMDVLCKVRPAVNVRAVIVCADVREQRLRHNVGVLWPRAKDDKARHKWGEKVDKPTPFPRPKKGSFWEGDAKAGPLMLDQTCQVEEAFRDLKKARAEIATGLSYPSQTCAVNVKDEPADQEALLFTWWLTKQPKDQPLGFSSEHIQCLRHAGIEDWKQFRHYGEEDFAEMERVLTQTVTVTVTLNTGQRDVSVSVPLFIIRKLCRAIRKLNDETEDDERNAEVWTTGDWTDLHKPEKGWLKELWHCKEYQKRQSAIYMPFPIEEEEKKIINKALKAVQAACGERQAKLQGTEPHEDVWLEKGICAAERDTVETLEDIFWQTVARFRAVRERIWTVVRHTKGKSQKVEESLRNLIKDFCGDVYKDYVELRDAEVEAEAEAEVDADCTDNDSILMMLHGEASDAVNGEPLLKRLHEIATLLDGTCVSTHLNHADIKDALANHLERHDPDLWQTLEDSSLDLFDAFGEYLQKMAVFNHPLHSGQRHPALSEPSQKALMKIVKLSAEKLVLVPMPWRKQLHDPAEEVQLKKATGTMLRSVSSQTGGLSTSHGSSLTNALGASVAMEQATTTLCLADAIKFVTAPIANAAMKKMQRHFTGWIRAKFEKLVDFAGPPSREQLAAEIITRLIRRCAAINRGDEFKLTMEITKPNFIAMCKLDNVSGLNCDYDSAMFEDFSDKPIPKDEVPRRIEELAQKNNIDHKSLVLAWADSTQRRMIFIALCKSDNVLRPACDYDDAIKSELKEKIFARYPEGKMTKDQVPRKIKELAQKKNIDYDRLLLAWADSDRVKTKPDFLVDTERPCSFVVFSTIMPRAPVVDVLGQDSTITGPDDNKLKLGFYTNNDPDDNKLALGYHYMIKEAAEVGSKVRLDKATKAESGITVECIGGLLQAGEEFSQMIQDQELEQQDQELELQKRDNDHKSFQLDFHDQYLERMCDIMVSSSDQSTGDDTEAWVPHLNRGRGLAQMLYEFGNARLARSLQVQPEWIHVELANVAMRPPHLIKGDERAPAEEKDVGKAYDAGLVKGDAVVARRKHYFEARVVRHCDEPDDYVALESSPPHCDVEFVEAHNFGDTARLSCVPPNHMFEGPSKETPPKWTPLKKDQAFVGAKVYVFCTKYYAGKYLGTTKGGNVKVQYRGDSKPIEVRRCYVKKRAQWAVRPQASATFGGESAISREFHDFAATRAQSARDRMEQERRDATAKENAEKVKKKPEEHAKHIIAGEAVVAEDVLEQLGAKALVEHTDTVPKHHEEKWTACDSSTGNGIRMFLQFIMHPDDTNTAKEKKKKKEEDEIIKKYIAEHAKGMRDACVGTTGKQDDMYNQLDDDLGLEPKQYSARIMGVSYDQPREIGKCLKDAAKAKFSDEFYWHRPTLKLIGETKRDKTRTKKTKWTSTWTNPSDDAQESRGIPSEGRLEGNPFAAILDDGKIDETKWKPEDGSTRATST